MPPSQKKIEQFYYLVTAFIHSVKIDRNVQFESRVLWKRKDIKVETKNVINNAQGGVAVFQEGLVLPLTFVYDKNQKKFLEKKTDFYSVVVTSSGLKSGGSVRYDVSRILNEGLEKQTMKIKLLKSPDSNAYIQVSFSFEQKSEPFQNQNELGLSSILQNTSIVLNENGATKQNNSSIKQNSRVQSFLKDKTNQNTKKTSFLKKEKPSQLVQKQVINDELQQKIIHLESTLKEASSQIRKRDRQIVLLKQNSTVDYKVLYQQELKKNAILQNMIFQYESNNASKVQQSIILELKQQLSDVKFNIGKMLNSAEEIGGPKLVDELCNSIGISQFVQTS